MNQASSRLPKAFLQKWVDGLSSHLKKRKLLNESLVLTLVFLEPLQAKKLNHQYRKKNYATDVLSFEGDLAQGELGELILCPQVLKKQAKEHGLSYQAELGYMVIHGVLHLLGYDHEHSEAEARQMFSVQDQIFDKMTRAL